MLGLGSSSTLGLGIIIKLDDQFTKAADKVASSLGDIDAIVESFSRMESFGESMANFGSNIIRGLSGSVREFAKFEDVMNSVKVIAGDQGLTSESFAAMNAQVKELGENYGILPDAVGRAQLELAKAGIKPAEIMRMTEATMALGAATDTAVEGVGGAAEMLVNVMQAFNATAAEADKYAALMTSAANQSTIDVKDLYQSMRYAADVANSLGFEIHETSAAIATLGNAGIKGSIAGTSLGNMFRYLTRSISEGATSRQKAAMELLGLTPGELLDSEGRIKSIGSALLTLRTRFKELQETKGHDTAFMAATDIFGVRGLRAAYPLMFGMREEDGKRIETYEDMYEKLGRDLENKVHITQAQQRLDDLLGDYQKFLASMARVQIAIGSAFGPVIRPVLQRMQKAMAALTEFFEGSTGQHLVRLLGGSSVLLVVFGKMIAAASKFYTFIVQGSGKLTAAFATSVTASKQINTSLVESSNTFLRNITLAANRWVLASTKAGILNASGMVQARGAGGRFGKTVGRASWATAFFGLFGRAGLRTFSRFSTWFGKAMPWLTTLGRGLRLLGPLLGRVIGGLFSWPMLILDLASTFITGKSLFSWLWELIKYLGKKIGGLIQFLEIDNALTRLVNIWDNPNTNLWQKIQGSADPVGKLINPVGTIVDKLWNGSSTKPTKVIPSNLQTPQSSSDPQLQELLRKTLGGPGGSQIINLTVNAGDSTTKYRINLDQERSLQSYAIN